MLISFIVAEVVKAPFLYASDKAAQKLKLSGCPLMMSMFFDMDLNGFYPVVTKDGIP